MLSLTLLLALYLICRPDEEVRIVFCDVGQGDGVLVSLGTFQMVYDTGPANKKMLACLERHTPFWDKKIEVVVISHWDNDHSGGLTDLVNNYKIGALYSSQKPPMTGEQLVYTADVRQGDVIRYRDLEFAILSPDEYLMGVSREENDLSVVGLLEYGMGAEAGLTSVYLMGDVPAEVEQRLVWRGILRQAQDRQARDNKIEIIKISHHGSKEGTSQDLLEAIKPEEAIISVGKNSFGHPTKEVLERLEKMGVKVRRTDEEGEIEIEL